MEVNSVAIQLALLFVPGLFWAMIDAAHRPASQSGQFVYTLRVFAFGVIAYSIIGIIYRLCGAQFDIVRFSRDGWHLDDAIDELLWAVLAALILSIFWLYGRTYKIVTRFLNKIGATNHIADQDIWEFMFNSDQPKIKYSHVRDYSNELIYAGYVVAYSERTDLRELAMVDVCVYDSQAQLLYETPRLYLARSVSEITLEFPVAEN